MRGMVRKRIERNGMEWKGMNRTKRNEMEMNGKERNNWNGNER